MENGSIISNILSRGSEPDELYLTFTFEWQWKDIEPGTEEAKQKKIDDEKATLPTPVIHSIVTMRKLVNEGKI